MQYTRMYSRYYRGSVVIIIEVALVNNAAINITIHMIQKYEKYLHYIHIYTSKKDCYKVYTVGLPESL